MSRALFSADAEAQVIGACLLSREAREACRDAGLSADGFADRTLGGVYTAILTVDERGEVPDPVTVAHVIARESDRPTDDWVAFLRGMEDGCPTPVMAAQHAKIVCDYAARRVVERTAVQLATSAGDQRLSVPDLLNHAEQAIYAARPEQSRTIQPLKALLPEAVARVEAKQASPNAAIGVPTPFGELNRLTFGWHPGQLIVLAARPSVGKTSVALQCAIAACLAGHRVLFNSLEMSAAELTERLMAIHSRVPLMGIRGGSLSDEQMTRMGRGVHEMTHWRLGVDDLAGATIGDLRSRARRANPAGNHPIGLVIVDYLQLVASPGAESRQNEVSAVSRGLKAMAKELRCPVLALSQLNRSLELRGKDAEPQLSDLRESGAIEQDADVVTFLHRPDKESPEATMIVGKNRQGPLGRVPLQFRKASAAFGPQTDAAQWEGAA